MTPKLPVIYIYRESSLDIITGEYPLDEMTLYGLFKKKSDKAIYYDQEGVKWECIISSSKYKPTILNKILANTINPTIKVEHLWTQIGRYTLPELKDNVKYCIDEDDDMLTQFLDANELKSRIDRCDNFNSILDTLLQFVFKPNKYRDAET
jgi:hypothetical protein